MCFYTRNHTWYVYIMHVAHRVGALDGFKSRGAITIMARGGGYTPHACPTLIHKFNDPGAKGLSLRTQWEGEENTNYIHPPTLSAVHQHKCCLATRKFRPRKTV